MATADGYVGLRRENQKYVIYDVMKGFLELGMVAFILLVMLEKIGISYMREGKVMTN